MSKPRIIVAVSGGIAAYKTPDLVSALKKSGEFEVEVMQTPSSENFVTPAALKVMADKYWTMDWGKTDHIDVTEGMTLRDAFVVVPATANTIGKIANGMGDNIVTDTALSLPNSVHKIVCYSMNTRMVNNKAVQRNIEQLKVDGWDIVEPVEGLLACGTTGAGKLPPTRELVGDIFRIIKEAQYER